MKPSLTDIAGQHMLGGLFRTRGNDLQMAEALLDGVLTLDNHPGTPIDLQSPDWFANPLKDNNWQFSFHSLRWVDVLRRSYLSTNDQRFLDAYVSVVSSWHDAHTAGSPKKVSRFAWYDMGAGLRVLILAGVLHTIGDQEWLLECVAEHGRRMSPETFGHQVGNHIIHIHNGLMTAGHLMGEQGWMEMATYRLKKLLVENVNLEGVADDGAIQYQINNYNWYREALEHARAAGIEHGPEFGRVDLMPQFLVHSFQTNRALVQFGDSDRTAVPRFDTPELQYLASKGTTGRQPADLYTCYRQGGYAFGRTHWEVEDMSDVLHYSVRFGPPQSAHTHAHQDGGSITVNYGGVELHPEGGRYRYDTQPMSVYFKSQKTHNTVLIACDEFDPDAPTELLQSVSTPGSDLTVVRRVEKKGSLWQRAVHHDRPSRVLTVTDYVEPERESEVVQLWQLPQDALVRIEDHCAHVFLRGKQLATLSTEATAPLYYEVVEGRRSAEYIDGWRSIKYGECFAAPVLKIGMTVARGLVSTVVAPRFPALEAPEVNVALTSCDEAAWTTVRRGNELSSTRFEITGGQLRANHMKGTRR